MGVILDKLFYYLGTKNLVADWVTHVIGLYSNNFLKIALDSLIVWLRKP